MGKMKVQNKVDEMVLPWGLLKDPLMDKMKAPKKVKTMVLLLVMQKAFSISV
jgi:hypothetical protein